MAAWLDAEGGKGEGDAAPLLSRMMALSVAYQRERQNVEGDDLTSLVIRALGMIVGKLVRDGCTVSTVSTISTIRKETRFIPTVLVTGAAHSLIGAYEIDINPDMVTRRRIGKVLTKMRFIRHRVAGGGNRGWMISLDDVIRWAESYGLNPSAITGLDSPIILTNGTNGSNGTNGTEGSDSKKEIFEGIL